MAVLAVTESTQYANVIAVPPVALTPVEHHGRLRMAWFDWVNGLVAGDAGGVISLVKLPAGRVRILGMLSNLYSESTTGSQTYDIGWAAYTGIDDVDVDADPDGLDDGLDVDTVGNFNLCSVLATSGYTKIFESQEGVIITLTAVQILAASEGIYGGIAYILD